MGVDSSKNHHTEIEKENARIEERFDSQVQTIMYNPCPGEKYSAP
jgi:hypothetical protein